MGGLYFKYGVMGSSKTANLLMTIFNYESQGFKVVLLKPSIDTRDDFVRSRIGLEKECIRISPEDDIREIVREYEPTIIFVDECQFLTVEQVEQLEELSYNNTVLCYGLKDDFKRELFPASAKLFALADSLQEIKHICSCGKRAQINARFKAGKICLTGNQVGIEGEYQYKAVCKSCFKKLIEEA